MGSRVESSRHDAQGPSPHAEEAPVRVSTRPVLLIAVFDTSNRVWLRSTRPSEYDFTNRGRVANGESTTEAAYRLEREVLGFSIELREVAALDPLCTSSTGEIYVAVADSDVPREFVAWPVEVVLRLADRGAEGPFGPVTGPAMAATCRAFISSRSRAGSKGRHPASRVDVAGRAPEVWRPRPRVEPLSAPHSVDLRITGTCQLRCAWCWGPEHSRRGTVESDEWEDVLKVLAERGTRQLILSGGEPTKSASFRRVVKAARRASLSITLSTNGIQLADFRDVLGDLDDIGIPLDGSTPDVNDAMRRGSKRFEGWEKALGAMRLVQDAVRRGDSHARLTARVVVARPNLRDVPNIPRAMADAGVDLARVRIKLYQVEPFGPHYGTTNFERDWAVTNDEACECATATRARAPEAHVELQLYSGTVGRYFLVDPDGWATGTDEEDGTPIEVRYGNIVDDLDATLAAYRRHQMELRSTGG